MHTDDPEDWTEEERRSLDRLARSAEPPAGLEDRIVERLTGEGMLGTRSRRSFILPGLRVLASAAAAIAVFGAGWAAGHGGHAAPRGPRFALLLYEGRNFSASESHAEEYAAWAGALRDSGVVISGEELSEAAPRISREGFVPDGDGVEKLAGFFVVGARDLATAEAIARTCPHLRFGGIVAVRRVAGK